MSNNEESVTRQMLATKVAAACDLPANKSTEVVNQLISEITSALNNGQDVLISGFGKFELLSKAARKGRNPRTGAAVNIPARTVVKFRPAIALKKHLTDAATTGS
jgi:DNA-binding protein HU-beta